MTTPRIQWISEGSRMTREFHAEIPNSNDTILNLDYRFDNAYHTSYCYYFGGGKPSYSRTEYTINYGSHELTSYKMGGYFDCYGGASLSFTKPESAQAFLDGINESNITKVLTSLNDTFPDVNPDNVKKVRALFEYVDKNALARHSMFNQSVDRNPSVPESEKAISLKC